MSDSAIQKRQAAFYTLEYYQNEMGRLLRRGQENLLNRIQQTLGSGVSLESVNPIVARDFPRYLRYSFIALLVSFAENELEELCIEMGQDKGLSDQEVKATLGRAGKIKNSKKFMKEHLADIFDNNTRPGFIRAMDIVYEPVLFLVRVRNCILHSSGNVKNLKSKGDKLELQNGVEKYSGFNVVDDFIILEEKFCKFARDSIQNLFTDLSTVR